MQIAKQDILDLLQSLGREQERARAEQELPDQVDLDRHADLLDRYGVDGRDLADKLRQPGGGLGGEGGLLDGQGV